MFAQLVLLIALPAAEPNEAEKLFRQMETQLLKAKAVECTYEMQSDAEKNFNMKGTLLAEGNKFRLEIISDIEGASEKITVLTDGVKLVTLGEKSTRDPEAAPKWLPQGMRIAFVRSGFLMSSFFASRRAAQLKEFKVEDQLRVSEFKIMQKDKIGDKEAQAVQYTLTMAGTKEPPMTVTVWLDTKTNLPLKRVLNGMKGDKKVTLTETYTKVELDGKLDPKQFELPKK
jgi:outer membrane lipoprotein-sorting protein